MSRPAPAPVTGSVEYGAPQPEARRRRPWRLVLGLVIVVLVLAFPQGLAGFAAQRWESRRGEATR